MQAFSIGDQSDYPFESLRSDLADASLRKMYSDPYFSTPIFRSVPDSDTCMLRFRDDRTPCPNRSIHSFRAFRTVVWPQIHVHSTHKDKSPKRPDPYRTQTIFWPCPNCGSSNLVRHRTVSGDFR